MMWLVGAVPNPFREWESEKIPRKLNCPVMLQLDQTLDRKDSKSKDPIFQEAWNGLRLSKQVEESAGGGPWCMAIQSHAAFPQVTNLQKQT